MEQQHDIILFIYYKR